MPENSIVASLPSESRHPESPAASQPFDALALLALSPDAVAVFDRDFRITYANAHAIVISQLDPETYLGRVYWDLRPEALHSALEGHFRSVMHTREPHRFTFFHTSRNVWFDIQVSPFADGIATFYRDITAEKDAEQSRDANAQQLQQVYAATPDAILVVDRDWNFTFANQIAIDLLNAGPLVGNNLWLLFPGNHAEPYFSNYHRTMDERVPSEFEAFYPAPLHIWFRVLARPFGTDRIILFFSDITERKAVEARRDELHQRLDQVFDATSDGILSLDRNWTVTFINRRGAEIASPVGSIVGKNIWQQFPESLSPDSPFSLHFYRAMNERVATTFEAFYPAPLNAHFRVEAQPSPEGIILFFRDITADRVATDQLRDSENRYRILTDLNPQFIWMGDADGRISYANQRFLGYIGAQHAPDDSGNWINAFDKEDRDRVIKVWTRAISTGTDYDIEARLIRDADGGSRWFRLRASPVRDDAGTILHWLGVAIDIDDSRTFARTLHEKQLETERQRAELESIYENTPVGLALFDPVQFRYLRVNDELARMIGLPKDQIIGRSVIDVASGVASIGELFRQVTTGRPVRDYIIEGELSTLPGSRRTWNVNYFPIYDSDGKLSGITTASLEITQQKKTEAALIQSEKLAAVGRLASSISHEINNPLEAITNLLFLISTDTGLPPDLKVYVSMAQSELSRVSQIATQTLRFHRQAVARTSVTAASLVDAVVNLYQGRLANSGIRVQAVYATASPILCFENDIRQILNNLIANAIDAMRGGGRLLIRAHNTTDLPTGRRGVRITIADTGHGMSSATQRRLFEPFYTTKDLNGTGLGLWISQGIVDRHHGRLQLRSTQNPVHHGTVFSLFLPFA